VLEDRLSLFLESWPLVIGLIFMAFVLFLPRGSGERSLRRLRG
jgi:ABC-type branched-subunit amino acid transport system permease subunit